MQIVRYPKRDDWPQLIRRPNADQTIVERSVRRIICSVIRDGDKALRDFTRSFDGVEVDRLAVTGSEISEAVDRVPENLKDAIRLAKASIEKFHSCQRAQPAVIETSPGVRCWSKSVPIEKVGLYIPGGSAPLFSTVLMLGVPAGLAGCREIRLCSPPNKFGRIDDTVLFAASLCGINSIYKVGGAQAIAAMAYGTSSIPAVYKIFGPGNSYVTCAKNLVSSDVAIDMPAGPSEVAVMADPSANPRFVAADLLSQAEHGSDSQVLLVTSERSVIESVVTELRSLLEGLARRETAERSLANSHAILVNDIDEGIDLVNDYAPEHLILAVQNPDEAAERIINAGSVFLGNYSCESAGDYASGTNHTLPTGGFARSTSGLSIDSFVKTITFQKLTAEGIQGIGPAIEVMAAAEGLDAHKRSVSIRLEEINGV